MNNRGTLSWSERQPGPFEPEIVLPLQFFPALRGKEGRGGERRLIAAVLEDAVNCFQKHLFARSNRGRRLFREAERWMMSADRTLPFSFENICAFLSLDPEYIRHGLHLWARDAQSQAGRRFMADPSAVRPAAAGPLIGTATRSGATPAASRAPTDNPVRGRAGL